MCSAFKVPMAFVTCLSTAARSASAAFALASLEDVLSSASSFRSLWASWDFSNAAPTSGSVSSLAICLPEADLSATSPSARTGRTDSAAAMRPAASCISSMASAISMRSRSHVLSRPSWTLRWASAMSACALAWRAFDCPSALAWRSRASWSCLLASEASRSKLWTFRSNSSAVFACAACDEVAKRAPSSDVATILSSPCLSRRLLSFSFISASSIRNASCAALDKAVALRNFRNSASASTALALAAAASSLA
mmetsp:Transcript_64407/g.140205  ORF Transcript_64407/g.140205 Transcript_64407/m.140205 type:complete len:253 (-) Transcript_64407:211-969(-)